VVRYFFHPWGQPISYEQALRLGALLSIIKMKEDWLMVNENNLTSQEEIYDITIKKVY
jgi:hypothetical protein